MKKNKIEFLMTLMVAFLLFVAGCSSDTVDSNNSEKEKSGVGGVLKVALNSQPPTLDQPISTASTTRDVSRLIYETLVTTDSSYQPVPMLAESIEISDDGKSYTFHLRQGVNFHNDKEMIAEDVTASMERWMEKSSITGSIFNGAIWEAQDDYTVILHLSQPSSLTLDTLATANQAPAIMPKEIVESASAEGVNEYVGTGPFKFVEWKQDQFIHVEKYDGYKPLELNPSGLAGKKEALVDEIYFYIVPDASTRFAGLQTEEYDFAFGIPFENYEQLKSNDDLKAVISPSANDFMTFNKVEGLASNFKIREAINMALNNEEIMQAAFLHEDLYYLDSGYMNKEIANWASSAGSEFYNQNNAEKAKKLLQEAGYNGEEFRILSTRDFNHLYNMAVVIHEQLKQIGINATLNIYDWSTALDIHKNNPEEWDAFVTSSQIVSAPSQLLALSPTWGGGLNDQKAIDMMAAIETAQESVEAKKVWDDLQLYAWKELLPIVQLGGNNRLDAANKKVEGVSSFSGPIFWNTKVVD
ncbi:ABC transporter substrate-binding protein [Robertmurraya massiliosenegalensis]|uniref:ABC transporter substrate-binding protein n=1 Tax=Robertmurraya massiliosenegalensis TaxID=1287657 RepID=UPI0002F2769A|nr:ABC transporter substrate-binding protein [Robertmurraya massiliosenegalensis]